jgi:CheY-like chemotaxis protein
MSKEKIAGLDCILLVDDDDPTNFIHRKMIEFSNVEAHIQVTTSATEALEYLTSSGRFATADGFPQPGIIFLDINMPGMNGWDFLEDYRKLADDQKAKIIVVMLTSSINPADRELAESNTEITTFLQKPLTVAHIHQLVTDHFTAQ